MANSSTNIGEMLLENYEEDTSSNSKVFNKDVFYELIHQITNVENPDINTLEGLGVEEKTAADFRSYNDALDVTVTIAGIPWAATYLSTNDNGDPILTLWQAVPMTYYYFDVSTNKTTAVSTSTGPHYNGADNYSDTLSKYPSNLYGTSLIATCVLNNGGDWAQTGTTLTKVEQKENSFYAKFTMDNVSGSLTSFIEIPNNMPYQKDPDKESTKTYAYATSIKYDCNNDALVAPNADNMYSTSYTYSGNKSVNSTAYTAWGDDKLWLPSMAEVGFSTIGGATSGLWKTSTKNRALGTSMTYFWTRSTYYNSYCKLYVAGALGASSSNSNVVAFNNVALPAFHLNLRLAAERAGLAPMDEPNDVEFEYTGQKFSITDVDDSLKTWYDEDKIGITYPEDMTNAGVHQVIATINQDLADKGYTFKGDPDEEKGENETTRVFNFTITKKKITLSVLLDSGGMPYIDFDTGQLCEGDTAENGRAPVLGLKYTSQDGATDYGTDPPTVVGKYKATAYIEDAEDCNYELAQTYTCNFEIKPKDVDKPTLAVTSQEYSGDWLEFTLANVTDDVSITVKRNTETSQTDGDPIIIEDTVKVKRAGSYTITVSLADGGDATQWTGTTSNASYTITFTVAQKTLNVSFESSTGAWSWENGKGGSITAGEDSLSDDDVSLSLYYYLSTASGNKVTVTSPFDASALGIGTYYFCATLDASYGNNANYAIAGNLASQEFKVTEINADITAVTWYYRQGSDQAPASVTNGVVHVPYTGSAYTFFVDDTQFESLGVKVDTTFAANGYQNVTGTNAMTASLTATVRIVPLSGYKFSSGTYKEFTLEWQIDKAEYDLSGVSWSAKELTYNGKSQTVTLTGLPTGLSVSRYIYSPTSTVNVGDYTASVGSFANTNSNYNTPSVDAFQNYSWSIVAIKIYVSWDFDENSDSEGSVYFVPVLNSDNDKVEYAYYTDDNGRPSSTQISLSDIEVDETTLVYYWVKVSLKSSYSNFYQLVDETGNDPAYYISFPVGDNKTPVSVSLENSSVTYNGNQQPVSLIISNVMIKESDFTIEYSADEGKTFNSAAPTNAGSYVVRITLSQEDYALTGQKEFTYEIAKADYDLSNVAWVYSGTDGSSGDYSAPFTYNGITYTLSLSGFPAGVSVASGAYSGNVGANANDYTAKISSVTADTANYNVIDTTQFDLDWKIEKAQIVISWTENKETSGTNEFDIWLAETSQYYTSAYYRWEQWDGSAPVAGASALSYDEVVGSFNEAVSAKFVCYVALKDSDNYAVSGLAFKEFEIGGNKTAVTLQIKVAEKVYDGAAFEPSAAAYLQDGTQVYAEFEFSYFDENGEPLGNTAPVNAGNYTVQISLKGSYSDDYVISGESSFAFEIKKAQYDISSLRWTDGENEYEISDSISFIYSGNTVTLGLIGNDEITDFEVELSGETSGKDAGSYDITINIKVNPNYEDCDIPELFTWTITSLAVDLSGITWDYDTAKPYVYKRDQNGVVLQSVELAIPETLPQEVIDAIVAVNGLYGGTYYATGVGTYEATADLTVLNTYTDNGFKIGNFDITWADLGKLTWKINSNDFEMPIYDGSWKVFDGDTHDFAAACGLPEDWQYYIDITINITLPDNTTQSYGGVDGIVWMGYDAGEYELVFTVKEGINASGDYNVWIGDDDTQTLRVNVSPRVVTVSGWRGTGTKAQAQFDGDVLSQWYSYVVYDSKNQVAQADASTGKYAPGTYTRTVEATSQNIKIQFTGAEKVAFEVDESGNEVGVEIPDEPGEPDVPDEPNEPGNDDEQPDQPTDGDKDEKGDALSELIAKIKDLPLWQLIASLISIILILIFLAKTASNESKRKKAKKTIKKKYNDLYAVTFLGLAPTNWTVIACALIGVAVLSFIFMLISQKRRGSAEEALDDAKEEYEQAQAKKKDDEMKSMLMGMSGRQQIAVPDMGEIRGMIEDAMNRGAQQYLPQQASANDELIQKLIEENAKSHQEIQDLMQKLAEQQSSMLSAEREVAASNVNDEMLAELQKTMRAMQKQMNEVKTVAAANVNDETILKVVEKTEQNDETIKLILQNQQIIMDKLEELFSRPVEKQVVEVPVEKIVEKEVKIEVPVEVEKVVEKVVEVPVEVEKIVEVPVEKVVEIPAQKSAPKAKVVAPRLTLDEAYEKLSAKQKKFFDTLKDYALSKDKCKEKKSTYSILLGQSSVNPLVKLTIKKDTTVALFKMEDEFMKDIRRNASNDGAKIKVKETEVIIADVQAMKAAKEMIDLREDQIERYSDFLKEQRAMKK
ncbi:MAG: MBG domain-containing protein [Clostridia bacterium]|nr:MBG domain-containing protein [Clostridia bacterium]